MLCNIHRSKRKKFNNVVKFLAAQKSILSVLVTFLTKDRIWRQPELCPNLKCPGKGVVSGYYELDLPKLSRIRFQKLYRVSIELFYFLCENLSSELTPKQCKFRETLCVGKKIVVSLHVLKSNCDSQSVASIYKIGKSTVTAVVHQFCNAVIKKFYQTIVKFPHSEVEKQQIAISFEKKWGFPNTFGALDGSHIEIKKPGASAEDYFCYKKFYSVVLMALVDDNYLFR